MSWRAAFLAQARSDNAVRVLLASQGAATCHRLHYLQMVAEKLAKGMLADVADPNPPAPVHRAFVRLLQSLKGRRDVRQALGFRDTAAYRRFVDSLLETASRIELLAPSAAGLSQANAEHPWWDATAAAVVAPCDHAFALLDPRDRVMVKLEALLQFLLRTAT